MGSLSILLATVVFALPIEPPSLIRIIDVNSDGALDRVRVETDGALSIAVHESSRAFREVQQQLPDVAGAIDLLVTDLDGDGHIDLYVVAQGPNVTLLGDSTGGFVEATGDFGLQDDGSGRAAELLDVDGNGLDDVLLHNDDGDVLFWGLPGGGYERWTETPAQRVRRNGRDGMISPSAFRDDILAGKVALVTGGATGLGKEIARLLGQHGARLCIASRKQENLEATCRELEGENLDCMWVTCDIREPEQVERVVSEVLERHARLDILVNNAAGNFPAPISGISYNGFKAIVDIDLRGTYNVTKAVFEAYLRDHGGHIVNISAPFQNLGVSMQAHVAAAKAGVDSLTRTCAVEFGPYGIRVNAVAPGGMEDTEGLARFAEATKDVGGGGGNPLGHLGTKRDVANAVLFLVSAASSYVTGQVFAVDGGAGIDMFKMGPPGE